MRLRLLGAVLLWFAVAGEGVAEDLTTAVFPSEEELQQALQQGEIDSVQFNILMDILEKGIDSTNSYLLDELPNLFYFRTADSSFENPIESIQKQPFYADIFQAIRPRGKIRYRWSREMYGSERSYYRGDWRLNLNDNWDLDFKMRRDFDGDERFTSRRAAYLNSKGKLRKLYLGNFTSRLGLGTVLGYHNKRLDYSKELNRESILYPDYNGFNGGLAQVQLGRYEATGLVSYNRDDSFSLLTLGGTVNREAEHFTPGIIFGVSTLRNRQTESKFTDTKLGLYASYRYWGGYIRGEGSVQTAENSGGTALLLEGRHHFGKAEIKYAGWSYADDFLDLTAGSKAVGMRRTRTIPKIGFEYSDKRSGQKGLLMKTIVRPVEPWEFFNSLLAGFRSKDTVSVEFLTGLIRNLSPDWRLQFDYLSRYREKESRDDLDFKRENRWRLETRFSFDKIDLRTYIAYSRIVRDNDVTDDYFSFFTGFKYRLDSGGYIEGWSDLRRFQNSRIEYWYFYLLVEQQLYSRLALILKLSNRYLYDDDDENEPTVTIELKTAL